MWVKYNGVGWGGGHASYYCASADILTAGSPSLESLPLVGDWLPSSTFNHRDIYQESSKEGSMSREREFGAIGVSS